MQLLSSRLVFLLIVAFCISCYAQDERIPHAQDKPPGPALSPAEAIAKMVAKEHRPGAQFLKL